MRAAPVTVGDLTLASEHPGELFADAVEIAPRLPGTLVAVPVRLGDRVKKGDVVARIDDAELAHQIQEAAAAAAAAEANARRAQAKLELARTERARKAPLAKDELVSAQEMSELDSRSVIAGALTTIAVFVPVVFIEGFAGVFFREMALVVSFALAASLAVALFVVPALMSLVFRKSARPRLETIQRLN